MLLAAAELSRIQLRLRPAQLVENGLRRDFTDEPRYILRDQFQPRTPPSSPFDVKCRG